MDNVAGFMRTQKFTQQTPQTNYVTPCLPSIATGAMLGSITGGAAGLTNCNNLLALPTPSPVAYGTCVASSTVIGMGLGATGQFGKCVYDTTKK